MDQLPRGYIVNDGRLCLVQARTALTVGERAEVLRWVDLATQAPTNNPGDDAELGEEVTVVRAAAWQLLGDMRQAEQLAGRLAPLDGSSIWHSLAACVLGHLSAIVRRQRRRPSTVRYGVEARQQLAELHRVDDRAWTARPHRRRSRGLAGMQRQGRSRVRGGPRKWSGGVLDLQLGAHRTRAAVPSRPAADGGTGRAGARGQPRSARRWPGRVVVRTDDARRAARELGDRRAARELVLEARELLSRAPEPGTLALRLLGAGWKARCDS